MVPKCFKEQQIVSLKTGAINYSIALRVCNATEIPNIVNFQAVLQGYVHTVHEGFAKKFRLVREANFKSKQKLLDGLQPSNHQL